MKKKILSKIIIRTRGFIFGMKDKHPFMGVPLVKVWSSLCDIRFVIRKKLLNIFAKLKYDDINANKTIWINPSQIRYKINVNFNIWKNCNKVLKGHIPRVLFETTDVYKAFVQVFTEGAQWEQTDFYRRVLNEILRGKPKWECKNNEDWDRRLKEIDKLYHEIKTQGYKTQGELNKTSQSDLLDEITVVIDRDGELLLAQGRHRLSIAKVLGIPQIPIRIVAKHRKWINFKTRLIFFSKNYQKGQLYQPLTHPDLQDISHRRDGDKRFELIGGHITTRGTLLDIGANLGYFCHRFEDIGFSCFALEENRMCASFMKEIREMERKNFKIISKNIFEYKGEMKFNVVLALSVFHHFLEEKDTYLNLIKLLKRLETDEMFFESHIPIDSKNKKLYQDYSPTEFVNFILKHSCSLNKAEFIGKSERGRPIYKLFK